MSVLYIDGDLRPEVKEVLYELGNVGVGTAVIPIGNIRQMEIRLGKPNVVSMEKDIFATMDYAEDEVVVGVSTRMNETFDGSILFLLSREFVRNTVAIMTGEQYTDEQLLTEEDSVSAIQEMINYMTAGYAKVIGAYLDVPVYISAASVGLDQVKNITQTVVDQRDEKVHRVACVNTEFTVVDENGEKTDEMGHVLIFPDEKSVEGFLKIMEE